MLIKKSKIKRTKDLKSQTRLCPIDGKTLIDHSPGQLLVDHIVSGYGHQFRVALQSENPRLGIPIDTSQGTATQGTIHMDIAGGKQFGTCVNRCQHNEITMGCANLLA